MGDLLVAGTIHTLDPARPRAAAALLRDGRFACVGALDACAARARPGARRIDLGAGCAVPGLADAHGHVLGLGRAREEVGCEGAASAEACAARAAARARVAPAGGWIRGRGWDQNRWPGGAFPTADALGRAVPDHPAVLFRVDGHAAWVNPRALEAAGIGPATPDPPGGRVLRDPAGRPSGVLVDAAMDLVLRALPAPSPAELEAWLLAGLAEAASVGLTSVHDAGVAPEVLDAYRRLDAGGRLPVRVYAMIEGDGPPAAISREIARARAAPAGRRLEVRAVKLYADGALGSRGAALLDGYADEPGNRGLLLTRPDLLREKIAAIVAAGFQPAIHAIGDRACREVLRVLADAGPAARALRPRVEHLQVLDRADLPLLAASGAVASMQPVHAASDAPWVGARLGAARLRGAYAWRSAARLAAGLAFGSDFPIEAPDPRAGLAAAETRGTGATAALGRDEALPREAALRAFTTGAAFASFAEGRRGRVREGMDADLTLLADDLLAVPAAEVAHLPVTHAIVGGEVAWEAGRAE